MAGERERLCGSLALIAATYPKLWMGDTALKAADLLEADAAELAAKDDELTKLRATSTGGCTQTSDGECCYRKARRTIGDPMVSVGLTGTGSDATPPNEAKDKGEGE